MKKKFFYLYILSFIIFTILFGYSLVFGTGLIFSSDIKIVSKVGSDVFIDSNKLNNFLVIFSSNFDLSKYSIYSTCSIDSKFVGKKENKYIFKVMFKDDKCNNKDFLLKDDISNSIIDTKFTINFYKKSEIFSDFTDLNTELLVRTKKDLVNKIQKLSIYKNYNGSFNNDFEKFYYNNRLYNELVYKKEIINTILERRRVKYISPVPGYKIPNIDHKNKLPNTGRPYRENYTIGIHQGWDIDAPLGTNVSALDNGVIIRIVDGFTKNDLNKINYGTGLTYDQKVRNLDLLRGNQVWLKTSKGDVIFYSHLNEIYKNIKEGDIVIAGQQLGTIGKTGVPGDDYEDYHLHFEIHTNPYNRKLAGKYNLEDYMKWDRYYKGKSIEYIAEYQGQIFDL